MKQITNSKGTFLVVVGINKLIKEFYIEDNHLCYKVMAAKSFPIRKSIELPDVGYGLVEALPKPSMSGRYKGFYATNEYRIADWEQKLLSQPYIPCLDSKEGEQHHQYWKDRVWMETDEYRIDYVCSVGEACCMHELEKNREEDKMKHCTNSYKVALPAPVKEIENTMNRKLNGFNNGRDTADGVGGNKSKLYLDIITPQEPVKEDLWEEAEQKAEWYANTMHVKYSAEWYQTKLQHIKERHSLTKKTN